MCLQVPGGVADEAVQGAQAEWGCVERGLPPLREVDPQPQPHEETHCRGGAARERVPQQTQHRLAHTVVSYIHTLALF